MIPRSSQNEMKAPRPVLAPRDSAIASDVKEGEKLEMGVGMGEKV